MRLHRFGLFIFLIILTYSSSAQKKTFLREYTYQAGDEDSKNTARAYATQQMRNILLREIGEFLQTERALNKQSSTKDSKEIISEDYSEKIMAITAGIVEMKVLRETWNGKTYYIEALMAVDPKEVNKKIAEVLNDKKKTKELEVSRQRVLAAEAEADRLKKELTLEKNKNDIILKNQYQQQTNNFSLPTAYINDDNVKMSLAVPNKVVSGNSFEVKLTIVKGNNVKGFARFHQDLPDGFEVKDVTYDDGAACSFTDQRLRLIWVDLPQKSTLSILYRIHTTNPFMAGNLILAGRFTYIVGDERHAADVESSTISIVPQYK